MDPKKTQKEEKKLSVLLGLVDLFLLTGRPIGSNTLRENGFENISSATIRNYFSKLEKEGFLKQQHSSGGRIPTTEAYKLYANRHLDDTKVDLKDLRKIEKALNQDTREIASYLQHASESLSSLTGGAVFLSSPRFDQDLILEVKLMGIDSKRCLCVMITDFGIIHTETLYTPKKLSSFSLKRIESYIYFRMTGLDCPTLNPQEEKIASDFYSEILLRHIVNYSNFTSEDIYKTGFSKLLVYPEFQDVGVLATSLSIFEDSTYMHSLLTTCMKEKKLRLWIGDDLATPDIPALHSTILAIPYYINQKPVGAIAILGPIRMPYPKFFGILKSFSKTLSSKLEHNLYKYKITYREPKTKQLKLKEDPLRLEDKSEDF